MMESQDVQKSNDMTLINYEDVVERASYYDRQGNKDIADYLYDAAVKLDMGMDLTEEDVEYVRRYV